MNSLTFFSLMALVATAFSQGGPGGCPCNGGTTADCSGGTTATPSSSPPTTASPTGGCPTTGGSTMSPTGGPPTTGGSTMSPTGGPPTTGGSTMSPTTLSSGNTTDVPAGVGSNGTATGAIPGESAAKKTCPNVTTANRNTINSYDEQPVLITFRPMSDAAMQIDSICATLLPAPGMNSSFIYVFSIVYINNTNVVFTYIVSTKGPGVNYYGDSASTLVEYVMGPAGCNSFVVSSCTTCGDYSDPFLYGTTTNASQVPFSQACLDGAEQLIAKQGLCQENYILPYNLPTQCVYQLPCVAPSNPIASKQAGACRPNNQGCSS